MKNTLIKTIMIAALLFCTNLKAKASSCMDALKKANKEQVITSSKMIRGYKFNRMYGLQNHQNLKAYHLGAKFFNPSHKVPTTLDLVNSIKSHPYFVGSFNKEFSHEDYISLKAKSNFPFFFFEARQNGCSGFYLGNPKGLRHFTINSLDNNEISTASFSNSISQNYPDLNSFIKCTLEFHSDKYLI